jgi:hypothetical protein
MKWQIQVKSNVEHSKYTLTPDTYAQKAGRKSSGLMRMIAIRYTAWRRVVNGTVSVVHDDIPIRFSNNQSRKICPTIKCVDESWDYENLF